MAVVKELLRTESDGTLSFGDYTLASKTKLEDFEFQGNLYKVKTFAEITKWKKMVCLCMNPFRGQRWRTLRQRTEPYHLKFLRQKMYSLPLSWKQTVNMSYIWTE